MALSKIQAESMNLADTFEFSGTVKGDTGAVWTGTVAQSSSSSVIEQWTYSIPPNNNFVLNFEDGLFTSYKRYKESIDSKVKRELS